MAGRGEYRMCINKHITEQLQCLINASLGELVREEL